MSQANLSFTQTTDLIAKAIMQDFENELRARLYAIADEMVKEVAEAAARNVTANVETYHKIETGEIQLTVIFNKEKIL